MKFINDCEGWSRLPSDTLEYRIYTLWRNMIQRCTREEYHKTHPTYVGCKICKEWCFLSKFSEDIKSLPGYDLWRDNPGKKISLDKDTINPGNKMYDVKNCQFITMSLNSLEMNQRDRKSVV